MDNDPRERGWPLPIIPDKITLTRNQAIGAAAAVALAVIAIPKIAADNAVSARQNQLPPSSGVVRPDTFPARPTLITTPTPTVTPDPKATRTPTPDPRPTYGPPFDVRLLTPTVTPTIAAAIVPPSYDPIPTVQIPSSSPTAEQITSAEKPAELLKMFNDKPHAVEIRRDMDTIMSYAPDTPQRREAEVRLFQKLEQKNAKAGDILLAMEGTFTITGRKWGMSLLWKQRQSGQLQQYGIQPLDQARIKWAVDNGIDPRVLAMAIDVLPATLEIMQANPERFLEALRPADRNRTPLADRLANPGLLARLMMYETGDPYAEASADPVNDKWGLVYIGEHSALSQVNTCPAYYPSAEEDLKYIAKKYQDANGLPYVRYVNNIAGSTWPDKPSDWDRNRQKYCAPEYFRLGSGGAVGPQFMEIYARLFGDWANEANAKLGGKYPEMNLFNPYMALIASNLYISSTWNARHGGVDNVIVPFIVRPGYNVNLDDSSKIDVLLKWNPHADEARTTINAGYSYHTAFGRAGVPPSR